MRWVDFASCGRRADEAIDVRRLLWAGSADGVSFRGEFFAFDDLCSFPEPYGVTHLPVHIGGSSRVFLADTTRIRQGVGFKYDPHDARIPLGNRR